MNSITLTACAAMAMVAAVAIIPASAQTTIIYPVGTDCTGLVGNSKVDCANQAKSSASPDNSNNPSTSPDMNSQQNTSNRQAYSNSYPAGTVDPDNHENYRNYPGAGEDCAEIVGNTKGDCAHNATNSPSPDNSNNPDQLN